jgi:hypothetical protein
MANTKLLSLTFVVFSLSRPSWQIAQKYEVIFERIEELPDYDLFKFPSMRVKKFNRTT